MSFSTPFSPPNATPTDVGQIVANQVAYASYAITNANEFLGKLEGSIEEDAVVLDPGDLSNPDYAVATLGQVTALLTAIAGQQTTTPELDYDAPEIPEAPENEFSTVPDVTVPEFEAASPTLDFPTPPDSNYQAPDVPEVAFPTFDATSPTLDYPALPAGVETLSIPAEPAIVEPEALEPLVVSSMPTVPTFAAVAIPTAPVIEIPAFSPAVTMPADNFPTITNNFSWAEAAYESSLLDAATAKLLADLTNGGYGIEIADESALWERERARQIEGTNFAIEEIYRNAAARGFPMPPGDLNVAVQRAVQDASDKLSTVSRDIALKRADMYVENRKFTLQEVRSLETVLINFHNSQMERAINAAKIVVDLGIQVFNTHVARHNARLEAYKAEHAVFESKIRAALLQVEGYRTTMEGKRLELQSQTQQVELYRAQLAGVNALIEIYKTRAQVHADKVNIQKLRLEVFRGRVEVYSAQVQAKAAEMSAYEASIRGQVAKIQAYEAESRAFVASVEGAKAVADTRIANAKAEVDLKVASTQAYEARIRGETARVQAYEAESRAFIARVEGAKARTEALLGNLKAETEQAQARSRDYEAKITGYRAQIDRIVAINRDKVGLYQSQIQDYTAHINAHLEVARTGIAQERLSFDMRAKAIDAVIENAKVQLHALAKSADIRVATNNTTGDFMKVSVGSALGALNTIAADVRNS